METASGWTVISQGERDSRMDRASLDRLARFFGRERLGHLYLKAWRFLVDGMSRRLALPDYVGERILDHALSELDARLDEFRLAIDARPSVWLFALGWSHAEEILKGRTGDPADTGSDADYWLRVRHSQNGDDGLATSRAIVTALGELTDERHQILLCLDAVARGPANRQIVSEATGEGLLVVDELRREAREALSRAFAIHAPAGIERLRSVESQLDADDDETESDPLASALRAGLVDEDVFPPLGDIESLYGWLDRHFERSRAEIAIAALWKRLPPPEKLEVEEKMAPGPMVALAESLYERIEKLETGIAERLDAFEDRRDEPERREADRRTAPGRRDGTDASGGAGARLLRRESDDTGGPLLRAQRPRNEPGSSHARHTTSVFASDPDETPTEGYEIRTVPPPAAPPHVAPRSNPDGLVSDPAPASQHAASVDAPRNGDAHRDAAPQHEPHGPEAVDSAVTSAHARAGWRTNRHADPEAASGDSNGNHVEPASEDVAAGEHDANEVERSATKDSALPRKSRLTGFWKAIRPAPREKTHDEVVQRLEKYLPAGKKVRPAPPGSRLEDDPTRPGQAAPTEESAANGDRNDEER